MMVGLVFIVCSLDLCLCFFCFGFSCLDYQQVSACSL